MNRKEMLEAMEKAGSNGASALQMRSERVQEMERKKKLPAVKKGVKVKKKLLIPCDLAIPFNPDTGVADDHFNADNCYRPAFSATTVALALKELAHKNAATKKAFIARAGIEEWDTSVQDTLTAMDKKVFGKYRKPRVFSIRAVHVDIPVMTGDKFGKDYAISVNRDKIGNVVGDAPGVLKVHELFLDRCFEELADYKARCKSGEYKHTEQVRKKWVSDIFSKSPVSDEHPVNWVDCFELPLTAKYEINAEVQLDTFTLDDAEKCHSQIRYSKLLKSVITEYMDGLLAFDKYFDFYEVDMVCPVEGDDTSDNGKMLIGKDTKYEKPTMKLCDTEHSDKALATIREALDNGIDIEEVMYNSVYITPYTQEIENQLYTSLSTVLDVEADPFFTKEVIKKHSEVISLALGEDGDELILNVDAGLTEKGEGVADTTDLKKEYNLNDPDFLEDLNNEVFDDYDVELDVIEN